MNERALYRLLVWMSPAFPVGGFSYSHGLEMAVDDGRVGDRASLEAWVAAILAHGGARADATLFVAASKALARDDADGFLWAAERASVMRGSAELARESLAQGVAFLSTLRAAWPEDALERWAARLVGAGIEPAYPIAVALAAALAEVPLGAALSAYLQGFTANLVSAGLRLIPLGQTDGQKILAALEMRVADAVAAALARPVGELGSAAPMIDLLSMRHETQYTRLFRS